jgi:hypothetical protein
VAQSREVWLYWPSCLATKDRWGPKLEPTPTVSEASFVVCGWRERGAPSRLPTPLPRQRGSSGAPCSSLPTRVARVGEHSHSNSAARYAQLLVLHPLVEGRGGVADNTQGSPRNACEALPLQASGGKRAVNAHRNKPKGSHL